MHALPVFLRLESRPVLLVGGGTVALRKARFLCRAGARVTVVAPAIDPALAALLDALGQSVLVAPLFVFVELGWWLGFMPQLRQTVAEGVAAALRS